MPGDDFPQEAQQPDDGGQSAINWAAVWDEHAPRIRRIIERRAGSAAADDLLQETFERALRGQDRFDPSRPIAPWLNTIAFHLTSDVRRQRLASQEMLVDEDPDLLGPDDAEESYIASLRRIGIREAFASLNHRHRRVLQLVAIEGMTSEEVAEFEQMSTEAVKSVLARARVNFRASYAAFVERMGLLAGFGVLGPVVVRLRARFQRFAELATNHAGAITVAAVTTAVVGVAALPATKPAMTRATEDRTVLATTSETAETEHGPARSEADVTQATKGEASATVDGSRTDVDQPERTTVHASATAARHGRGFEMDVTAGTQGSEGNRDGGGGLHIYDCDRKVQWTVACAALDTVTSATAPGSTG